MVTNKMSLRLKLSLLLLALIAAVILIVAVAIFSNYSRRLDLQLEESSAAKMDAAAARIDSWFLINAQNAKTLRTEALNRMENIESFMPSLVAGLKENSDLSSMYFFDVVRKKDGGKIIEATGWIPPDEYDQYTRGWFTDTIATKNVILTAPYIDSITGKLVVTVSVRVDDAKGKTLGVVGLDVLLTTVETIAKALRLTENGASYLLDGGGLLVPFLAELGRLYHAVAAGGGNGLLVGYAEAVNAVPGDGDDLAARDLYDDLVLPSAGLERGFLGEIEAVL